MTIMVIFDVVGTLVSLEKLRHFMEKQGLPAEMLPWWFTRLLQCSMAATLAGRYIPFSDSAEASLRQLLAVAGRPEKLAEPVLAEMKALSPWPEAADSLQRIKSDGHRLFALSNSSLQATHGLLEKAGVREFFEQVISTDEAGACKPDPRPYRLALERAGCRPAQAWMVAAHGWDIVGAAAVGMRTVWVERIEKRWPFPGEAPDRRAADLSQVPAAITQAADEPPQS